MHTEQRSEPDVITPQEAQVELAEMGPAWDGTWHKKYAHTVATEPKRFALAVAAAQNLAEQRLQSLQHVTIALNELGAAVNSIALGGVQGEEVLEIEDALRDIEDRLQMWDWAGPALEAVHQYANRNRNADLINMLSVGDVNVQPSDAHTVSVCERGECSPCECFCWCHS